MDGDDGIMYIGKMRREFEYKGYKFVFDFEWYHGVRKYHWWNGGHTYYCIEIDGEICVEDRFKKIIDGRNGYRGHILVNGNHTKWDWGYQDNEWLLPIGCCNVDVLKRYNGMDEDNAIEILKFIRNEIFIRCDEKIEEYEEWHRQFNHCSNMVDRVVE